MNAEFAREPLQVIDPRNWQDKPVPPPWLVDDLIPMRVVILYCSDGGTGKTLTAMQLIAATALKLDWFGRPVEKPSPTLLYTAEDGADELHRRFAAIVAQEGHQYGWIGRNAGHAQAAFGGDRSRRRCLRG